MSAIGQSAPQTNAPSFGRGRALGTNDVDSINFKNIWGYDPIEQLISDINKAPTTDIGVERAIGKLLNFGWVGQRDVSNLANHLNQIVDPVKRQITSRKIKEALKAGNGYTTAQPEKAYAATQAYEQSEQERLQKIVDVLGDEAFDEAQAKERAQIAKGTAKLERYRIQNSMGRDGDANSIKKMWLQLFFPDASSEELKRVILNIGLAEPPKWIEDSANYALDVARRLFEGDFSGDLPELLKGSSNIEDATGNVLHISTMGISNMTQVLGQLVAGQPDSAKMYLMKEMLRQLDVNMGGNKGLKSFYERNKDKPVGAVRSALPFIVTANASLDLVNDMIDNVSDKFTGGLVKAPQLEEEGVDDELVDANA